MSSFTSRCNGRRAGASRSRARARFQPELAADLKATVSDFALLPLSPLLGDLCQSAPDARRRFDHRARSKSRCKGPVPPSRFPAMCSCKNSASSTASIPRSSPELLFGRAHRLESRDRAAPERFPPRTRGDRPLCARPRRERRTAQLGQNLAGACLGDPARGCAPSGRHRPGDGRAAANRHLKR